MNGVGKATFALQFSNGSVSFEKIKLGSSDQPRASPEERTVLCWKPKRSKD